MKLLILNTFLIYLSLFTLRISGQDNLFLNDWEPKSINSPIEFVDVDEPTNNTNVSVVILFEDIINKVSKYNFGNNANTYSTQMWDNFTLVQHLTDLNPNVLRYPGGNLSNEFFWNLEQGNKPQDIPQDLYIWYGIHEDKSKMSLDSYYKLLDAIGSTGIITVNYGYARYGTSADPVAQAAHLAAEWVRYDNGRTKFWEIGNENYGEWQTGYEIDTTLNKDGQPQFISGDLYGEHALIFIDSMKAAASERGKEIFIGVQAWEEESSYNPIQSIWNEKMMPIVGNILDYYIVHNYYTPYDENSSAEDILDSYQKAGDFKSSVYDDLAEFGLEEKPIALTEYNIFASGSQQQVSHINGLHASLVTGNVIKENYGLTSRWNLANGWDNGDDHGMFSKDEPGVASFTPYPDFYHLTFLQRYFGDTMVRTISTNPDIVVYATLFTSGHAGLCIINKGSVIKTIELIANDYNYSDRYYWYELKDDLGDGSFSKKVFINGEGPAQSSGGPDNYNTILPFSNEYNGNVKINVSPYSAIYMLMEGNTVVGVNGNSKKSISNSTKIKQNYPNPFNPYTIISYQIQTNSHVELSVYNMIGQKIVELVNTQQDAGIYNVNFNPNSVSENLSSGVYLYRIKVSNAEKVFVDFKKMTYLK